MLIEGHYRIILFSDADQIKFMAAAKEIDYPSTRVTRSSNSRILRFDSSGNRIYVLSVLADLMISQSDKLDHSKLRFPTLDQVQHQIDEFGLVIALELFEVLENA